MKAKMIYELYEKMVKIENEMLTASEDFVEGFSYALDIVYEEYQKRRKKNEIANKGIGKKVS